jgi:hypothetical protein
MSGKQSEGEEKKKDINIRNNDTKQMTFQWNQ